MVKEFVLSITRRRSFQASPSRYVAVCTALRGALPTMRVAVTAHTQLEFEESLFKKTRNSTSARMECEVVAADPYIAVFRCGSNVTFYVVGGGEEVRFIQIVS
jgi:hypothetical protein